MTQTLTIRPAAPADRPALGRLWQELMDFHHDLDPHTFDLRDDALDLWLPWLDEWLADPERIVLVADTGRELVGYAFGKPEDGPPVYRNPKHAVIGDTCVTASWRRRGVGRLLVGALLDWFRSRGLTEVRVGAAACNPTSNAFWRALGFEPYMVHMRKEL